jgi:hypothetical protein
MDKAESAERTLIAAMGVRSCPVMDPAADTEAWLQVSVWVPLFGLVDGRQIYLSGTRPHPGLLLIVG